METSFKASRDPVAEMINLKTKIEQEVESLKDERDMIRNRIQLAREGQNSARVKKEEDYKLLNKLKIELAALEQALPIESKHVENLRSTMDTLEKKIFEKIAMRGFEESMLTMRSSIEGAVNFYSDDSLQIEINRRKDLLREKRVTLTSLDAEYANKLQEIEESKKAKERERMAQLEKAREETERQRRLEEERVLSSRNHSVSSPSTSDNQSFSNLPLSPLPLPKPKLTPLSQLLRW